MRFVRLSTVYPHYLSRFYAGHPGFASFPYLEQRRLLHYDAFGWADYWSNALRPLGWEGIEIDANVEIMQKKWALESSFHYGKENWMLEIAAAQINAFRPEILFLNDHMSFGDPRWLRHLRQSCPSIRAIVGWCGSPLRDLKVFEAYDLILSCIPELVEVFRSKGFKVEHMHHAFEPRILERIPKDRMTDIDFTFVGQIVRTDNYHRQREELLKKLVKLCRLEIFSPSAEISWIADGKNIIKKIISESFRNVFFRKLLGSTNLGREADAWRGLPWQNVAQELRPFMRPAVYGLRMFETLRRSKISFNSHIDISANSASNMRLFEATGVGTCLLTDRKNNLSEIFEDGKEVTAYSSAAECAEKVLWLLDHPVEREQMAAAGQKRCLKDHTFARRAEQFDFYLKRVLR